MSKSLAEYYGKPKSRARGSRTEAYVDSPSKFSSIDELQGNLLDKLPSLGATFRKPEASDALGLSTDKDARWLTSALYVLRQRGVLEYDQRLKVWRNKT